jgi:hypothetical protein
MLYSTLFTMQAKAKLDEYLKNKPDADIQRRIKELDVKITTTSVSQIITNMLTHSHYAQSRSTRTLYSSN